MLKSYTRCVMNNKVRIPEKEVQEDRVILENLENGKHKKLLQEKIENLKFEICKLHRALTINEGEEHSLHTGV